MRTVAVSLALIVALPLVVSGCSLVGGGGSYQVTAMFPRAVSLYEQGAVQVLGLPAGKVTDIEVVGDQVKVTMAIDDDIPVPVGVKAAIVPQSLIGERRIQLFPPYQEGDQVITDGYDIPAEDTVVPVEPDEALAALKEFLDSLDPNGVGRLIDNAATTLDGQGANLGSALDELSTLVGNIEDNDQSIIAIADRFDDFTKTLLTRESQLGETLDDFGVVAGVLADERDDIERLIHSLAHLSGDGLDLVSQHAVRLRTDIDIVTRLSQSIDTNLGGIQDAIVGGRAIVAGFLDSYNPDLHALNLRTSFSPLVSEALNPIFDAAGVPLLCVPVDVICDTGGLGALDGGGKAVPARLDRPRTPVDDILTAFGTPASPAATSAADPVPSTDARSGLWGRFVGTFLGVGS